MAKLYPPKLDGTVPAFYSTNPQGTRVTKLVVPFTLNRVVGDKDIRGFALKIKTIQSNTLLNSYILMRNVQQDNKEDYNVNYSVNEGNCYVSFDVSNLNLTLGQFYKVQLAFVDETNTVGYYSSTAVTKYASKPEIIIQGLKHPDANAHLYSYTGIYKQDANGDATEKLASSRFILETADGDVCVDSGEIIHHTYNDDSNRESHEEFLIPNELDENKSYYLTFIATTNNGMVVESPRYRIIKTGTVTPDLDVTLTAQLNFDEGYVDLILKNNRLALENKSESKVTGMFYIVRAASNDNWAWRDMGKFALQSQLPSKRLWSDYSIEQGVQYKYAIQQYNTAGLRSDRIEAPQITADFEDAFLYDGKRQLRIRFNPKVSSFKRDIIEQKTDTIGSKYPFIFRNGNVDYHEFPISGLISYLTDENQKFLSLDLEGRSNNLTGENIFAERTFKMEVLQWLTNGKPKLFKSPAEGNYAVRLLNVSLSPNDTLGRMLHTFSATAYEISDTSYESLMSLGFVEVEEDTVQTRYHTVEIAGHSADLDLIADSIQDYHQQGVNMQLTSELIGRINNAIGTDGNKIDISKNVTELGVLVLNSQGSNNTKVQALSMPGVISITNLKNKITYASGKLNTSTAYSVDIRECRPGTIFEIDGKKIVIGSSGSYYLEMPTGIKSIYLPPEQPLLRGNPIIHNEQEYLTGNVTYGYHSDMSNVFDLYESSHIDDYPVRVWYGTASRDKYNPYKVRTETTHDIIQCIEDVKTTIVKFFKMNVYPRPIQPVFEKVITTTEIVRNEETNLDEEITTSRIGYFYDMDCTEEMLDENRNPAYVYQVCNPREDYSKEDYYHYTQWFTDANYRQGYYMSEGKEVPYRTTKMIDGAMGMDEGNIFYMDDDYYNMVFNGQVIEVKDMPYTLEDLGGFSIQSLQIGKGLVCELSYQTRVMFYSCEDAKRNSATVASSKYNLYQEALNKWNTVKHSISLLEDEHIIKRTTNLQELLTAYDQCVKYVKIAYEDLCKYVSIEKKEFEEAMKS